MQLMLVGADLNFSRVIESVLSSDGIRVDGHPDPAIAWQIFSKNPADLVLVDMPPEFNAVDQFLGKLREDAHGAQVPVILMSEKHHAQSKAVATLLKKHYLQSFLPRPFEMFGIASELKRIASQGGPKSDEMQSPSRAVQRRRLDSTEFGDQTTGSEASAERQANIRNNFRMLKDIWIHQRTGVLRREEKDDWVLIYQGGLQNESDEAFISAVLTQDNLQFQQTHQDGVGDSTALGRLLWEHAQQGITVSFEAQLDKKSLKLSPISKRRTELPLSHAIQTFLKVVDPHLTIGAQLSQLGIRPQDISQQLGALKAMGLVELIETTEAPPGIPTNIPPTPESVLAPPVNSPRGPRRQTIPSTPETILKRLDGEYSRLKNADDFTILGLPQSAEDSMVHATWSRLRDRYTEMAEDESLPTPIRRRAESILRLSKEAAKRVLSDRKGDSTQNETADSQSSPPAQQELEELAFNEGVKAFAAGDHKRAVQCFRKARDERIDSVRNMAWLGWAVFHNTEKPQEERNEEALDLLRLASSFDPSHRQGQFFLSFVELKTGAVENAVKRLTILLKRYPGHKEAKKLMRMIAIKSGKQP
jgi:DNA-binding response OmpR family regulator